MIGNSSIQEACDNNNVNCTTIEVSHGNVKEYINTSSISDGEDCHFLACVINNSSDHNNMTCASYNFNCSSKSLCEVKTISKEGERTVSELEKLKKCLLLNPLT